MGKKQSSSIEEKNAKHEGCIFSAYKSLAVINTSLADINNSRLEFIGDKNRYKACSHDISNMLSALMASPSLNDARISSGTLQNKTIGQIRGAFFKKDNQSSHQLNEIRDLDDVTPQNLWDHFLVDGGFVSQCADIIKDEIVKHPQVSALIEEFLSKQETFIPDPNEETAKHHQSIINQLTEQLAINTDRIVAMCKLLPRPTKEQFQNAMKAVFEMDATMFQAVISCLRQKNILLETAQFYLIEDQSFALQAVANFQKNEDVRSVYHKLQKWKKPMSKDLANGFLQSLAQVISDDVLFKEQAASIKNAISKATTCEEVEQELKALHGFDYRVPDLALEIVQLVFEIAGKNSLQAESFLFKQYGLDVRSSAFPILKRLAYHIPSKVIPLLWENLSCEAPQIVEEATEALKKITEYDREILPNIGITIQQEVGVFLNALPKENVIQHLGTALTLCSKILSLEAQSTRFTTPDTIVFTRGALFKSEELCQLRAAMIALLENLYEVVQDTAQKRHIIGTLHSITRHPYRENQSSTPMLELINSEVESLLSFYERIIPNADNEILQKIGHDLYWMHYHHATEYNEDTIYKILRIRDKLYNNEELNVFNVLVGFDAIFPFEWEKKGSSKESVIQEEEFREEKVAEYLKAMNASNYALWQERILSYVKIESNDLATFIYFRKFMVATGVQHPEFTKALLTQRSKELRGFRSALLEGLLESDNTTATAIFTEWLDGGIYLQSVCHVLEQTKNVTLEQYEKLRAVATVQKDRVILILLIGALAQRYSSTDNTSQLIISAIKELTKYKDARWINVYWWRKKLDTIAEHFSNSDVDVILESLLYAPSIGTHEEWILAPIAKKYPIKTMAFFKSRIQIKDINDDNNTHENDEKYEAIPYRFYEKLSVSLD